MTVWLLFHETNAGHSEESDGYVEAVYATEALAEAAKLAAIRALVAEGHDVYWNPDTEEEGPSDWTDDFRVIAMDVKTALPKPDPLDFTCPTCHAVPGLRCVNDLKRPLEEPHRRRVFRAARARRQQRRKAVKS